MEENASGREESKVISIQRLTPSWSSLLVESVCELFTGLVLRAG